MGLTEESHCDELVNDKFAEVFQFKNCFIDKCKKEIVEYIEEFPQLDGNSVEEIYDKIVGTIQTELPLAIAPLSIACSVARQR